MYSYVTAHTHPFNGPLSGTTQVSRYQKGKTNLDFTEARDSDSGICTLIQTDNHASTPPLRFLYAGCRSCCPTNSVIALKAVTASLQITGPDNADIAERQQQPFYGHYTGQRALASTSS